MSVSLAFVVAAAWIRWAALLAATPVPHSDHRPPSRTTCSLHLRGGAALLLLLAATGCGGIVSRQAVQITAESTIPSPVTAAQPSATATPAQAASGSAGAEAEGTLRLEVIAPADEAVVRTRTLEVRGKTAPEAIVTVNGYPAEVDLTGAFVATVELARGPNLIEIIASDFDGREQTRLLTVISVAET